MTGIRYPHITNDMIREAYWDEGLSLEEVCAKLGIKSKGSLSKRMQVAGIPRRVRARPKNMELRAEIQRLRALKHSFRDIAAMLGRKSAGRLCAIAQEAA